jgi:aryl-alcohol dehydrogenase-like predicted oxidoreductase
MSGANFDSNLQRIDAVKAMARDKGVTAAQLALAWVLAQGDEVVLVPATRHLNYLEDNIAAARIELTPAEFAHLGATVPPSAVAGQRYAETSMKRLGL